MKKDYGQAMLDMIRKQHTARIKLANGEILVTNPLLYRQCEEEIYRLAQIISRENKKLLKK
jgi:hypothetical protein